MNLKEAREIRYKVSHGERRLDDFIAEEAKGFIEGYEAGVREAVQKIVDMVPELNMEDEYQVKNEILKLLDEEEK